MAWHGLSVILMVVVVLHRACAAPRWPATGTSIADGTVVTFPADINFLDNPYTTLTIRDNGIVAFDGAGAAAADPGTYTITDDLSTVCDAALGPFIAVGWAPAATSTTVLTMLEPTNGDASGIWNDANPNSVTEKVKTIFSNSLSKNYGTTSYVLFIEWTDVTSTVDGDTNAFQLFIISDGCQTYIALNYNQLNDAGQAGDMATPPIAAISSGDGGTNGDGTCLVLPFSSSTSFPNLLSARGNGNDATFAQGFYVFRVDTVELSDAAQDPVFPLSLCLSEYCVGTCDTTSCVCTDPSLTGTWDCSTVDWYGDGCTLIPGTDGPCEYLCARSALSTCPAPCGGCGTAVGSYQCDDCSAPAVRVGHCGNNKCANGVPVAERYLRRKGRRTQRVRRNRKCCYSYFTGTGVFLGVGVKKSCCRPRIAGFIRNYVCP